MSVNSSDDDVVVGPGWAGSAPAVPAAKTETPMSAPATVDNTNQRIARS